jgi:hypothetical protein
MGVMGRQRRGGPSGEGTMRRSSAMGLGPDRPQRARAGGAVRTGARRSLTHVPRLAAAGRGRGEARGAWAGLEKKEAWAEPEGTGTFLIYSNEFKLVRIVLIKRWTYWAPKTPNKIWLERV